MEASLAGTTYAGGAGWGQEGTSQAQREQNNTGCSKGFFMWLLFQSGP